MIGTSVRLDGAPHTVIGVMPASFQFPDRAPSKPGRRSSCAKTITTIAPTPTSRSSRASAPASPSSRRARSWTIVSARLEQQYPEGEQGHPRDGPRTARRALGERAPARARALRRHAVHPAPRLREPGEPVPGARRPPRARAGRARRARRRTRAAGAPARHREPGDRVRRRHRGRRGRRGGRAPARTPRPRHAADRGPGVAWTCASWPSPRRSCSSPASPSGWRPRCARGGAARSTRCAAARARPADARSGSAPRSSSSKSPRRSCCSSRRGS